MAYEPLHHKYRPQTFQNLVGQGAIATTLSNAIVQQRVAPAYLFSGPRGTGKTSSARILAKSLNCQAGDKPTPQPCGQCEACRSITTGVALDVIEIDAASNTGVDNIRELIEKAQFAPVQCRYKVYVIDECLTGDTQVITDVGLLNLNDPNIVGKKALSYNESSNSWEFKKIVRLLDQGTRQTYQVETNRSKIRCTGNHLIRTDAGWITAENLEEGMRILSPVNADVAPSFSNMERMEESVGLSEVISSKGTLSDRRNTISTQSSEPLNLYALSAPVAVENCLTYLNSCERRDMASRELCLTGKGIHTKTSTAFGSSELRTLSTVSSLCRQKAWASSTEHYWEIAPSVSQTPTVDFPDWPGRMVRLSRLGQNTRQVDYPSYVQASASRTIKATAKNQRLAAQPVIPSFWKFLRSLLRDKKGRQSLQPGSINLRLKALLGGTWMTAPSASPQPVARAFNSIRKDSAWKKIKFLRSGSLNTGTQSKQEATSGQRQVKPITTSQCVLQRLENSCPTSSSSQSPRWHTSLETVSAVKVAGLEPVYDIEVEDNHNFVANGLLVHNCHMLSAAAFNALLKTLEEPPERVVFVLATTDPQRVLPTIISRCQRFDYRRIPLEDMVGHLRHIADQELIDIHDDALRLVAQLSQGGLRDAESLLDQLSLLPPPVAIEAVWDLVGAVPERELFAIAQAIAQNDAEAVIERARQLMDRGREPLVVLQNLASFYRDLLVAKTAPQRNDLVAITPGTWQEMTQFTQQQDVAVILQGQQHLRSSEIQLKNSTQPRLWLEVTLMGLLPAALVQPQVPSQVVTATTAPGRLSTATPAASAPPPAASTISPPIQVPAPPAPPTVVQSQAASLAAAQQASPRPAAPASPAARSSNASATNQPPSSALPAANTAPETAASVDLGEMWKQVIANVEYRSTQMLLRQQSQLMRFTGAVAHIAVTQQWLSSIQTRQAAIEKAFARVAGSAIQIKLEAVAQKPDAPSSPPPAAKATAPSPTPPPARPAPSRSAPPSPSPPASTALPAQPPAASPEALPEPIVEAGTAPPPARKPEIAPSNESNTNAATDSAAIAQNAAESASAPITSPSSAPPPFEEDEVEISIDPMAGLSPLPTLTAMPPGEAMAQTANDAVATETSQATLAPIGDAAAPTALKHIWDEDEIVRSAKQLAQFFNGEVVRDDVVTAELTPSSSTVEKAEGETVAIASQSQSVELLSSSPSSDEDDDVPF